MSQMGRKAISLSLGATGATGAINIEHQTRFSVIVAITGASSLNGVLTIEGSNDAFDPDNVRASASSGTPTENTSATWATIAGSSQTITADGTYAYNTSDAAYTAFRLKWTRTGGTATAAGYSVVKGT